MKSITQVIQNLLKPYIDNHRHTAEANISPVETDATSASQNYSVGQQLILNDVLYDVTAAITAGDALFTTGAGSNISAAAALTTKINDIYNSSIQDVYQVTTPSFSSLPQTFTALGITSDHRLVVDGYANVNPESSKGSDWTIITGTNSIQITGTFNGSTAATVKMTLGVLRTKTAT